MRRLSIIVLLVALGLNVVLSQTLQKQDATPEDVIRITTELVQTDVVVTDKNDRIISDLGLGDFELYDNGRRQEVKFLEYVSAEGARRAEGDRGPRPLAEAPEGFKGVSAKEIKRVVAFVVDDLTVPFEDLPALRKLLLDFVDNKMRDGDLVAIVRVVGGKGLLQQLTGDRQLLRRAISTITPTTNPFMSFNNPDAPRFTTVPTPAGVEADPTALADADNADLGTSDISSANDDVNRLFRGLATLSTANYVISSMKEIPGRKDVVIISAGIPIFEAGSSGSLYSNVSYLLSQLTDNAARAGVVIDTLDPRGMRATPGVVGFSETPARSALGGEDPTFGRGGAQNLAVFGDLLSGAEEHLGLGTVANATGGVSVVNTNNFESGLNKMLARSNGYYTLAYRPSERFDNKFHKLEVKVKRSGAKVYAHAGFIAREDKEAAGGATKEEKLAKAALSPLARRDIDVTPNVSMKFSGGKALVDINLLIDTRMLHFNETPDGRHKTSLDIVGFVFDQLGRRRGGFSETVNLDLTRENYERALNQGLTYSASTELPAGYYQLRSVVHESVSGSLGTFSKYLEVPDFTKKQLALSSLFLFAVDPGTDANPTPLLAVRRLNPKQELRYAVMIYNAKVKDGKTQLRSQMIISQGNRELFREPEQAVDDKGTSPVVKVGQLGLTKVPPGKYVLNLLIKDMLADKKTQTASRSLDFTVLK